MRLNLGYESLTLSVWAACTPVVTPLVEREVRCMTLYDMALCLQRWSPEAVQLRTGVPISELQSRICAPIFALALDASLLSSSARRGARLVSAQLPCGAETAAAFGAQPAVQRWLCTSLYAPLCNRVARRSCKCSISFELCVRRRRVRPSL